MYGYLLVPVHRRRSGRRGRQGVRTPSAKPAWSVLGCRNSRPAVVPDGPGPPVAPQPPPQRQLEQLPSVSGGHGRRRVALLCGHRPPSPGARTAPGADHPSSAPHPARRPSARSLPPRKTLPSPRSVGGGDPCPQDPRAQRPGRKKVTHVPRRVRSLSAGSDRGSATEGQRPKRRGPVPRVRSLGSPRRRKGLVRGVQACHLRWSLPTGADALRRGKWRSNPGGESLRSLSASDLLQGTLPAGQRMVRLGTVVRLSPVLTRGSARARGATEATEATQGRNSSVLLVHR